MANTDNQIGSVETMFRVLETLKEHEEAGVTELARSLELPKSTVYSHLNTLKRQQYVQVEDGQYRLGLRFLSLGERARANLPITAVAKPEIDRLAEETGEVVNLMTEENGEGVYLYLAHGERAVKFDTYPGKRLPLYCTALGKVTLATLPADRSKQIIEQTEFEAHTENTIVNKSQLREELELVQDQGYALDREERATEIQCVAAPVIVKGDYLGGISVSGPTSRMNGEWFTEEIPTKLVDTASTIELQLRYS